MPLIIDIKSEISKSILNRTHSATAFYLVVKHNSFFKSMGISDTLTLLKKSKSWETEYNKANAYVNLLKCKGEYRKI